MATVVSIVRIFWSREARHDARRLQKVFVRLSLIQLVLGVLDLGMGFIFPQQYQKWYWTLLGVLSMCSGALGMYAGWKFSQRWTVVFAGVLLLRYVWYFIAEWLVVQDTGAFRLSAIPLPLVIGLFVLKTVYAIIYFSFLTLFYRQVRHLDRPEFADSDDEEDDGLLGGVADDDDDDDDDATVDDDRDSLSSGCSSGIEDSSSSSFEDGERGERPPAARRKKINRMVAKSYRLR